MHAASLQNMFVPLPLFDQYVPLLLLLLLLLLPHLSRPLLSHLYIGGGKGVLYRGDP